MPASCVNFKGVCKSCIHRHVNMLLRLFVHRRKTAVCSEIAQAAVISLVATELVEAMRKGL